MTVNPFGWSPTPFLAFYIALMVTVTYVGSRLRSATGHAIKTSGPLSVPELAFLSGGAGRLGDTLLFSLVSMNGATVTKGGMIDVSDQAPLTAVLGFSIPLIFLPNISRAEFQEVLWPVVDLIRRRLDSMGYYPNDRRMALFRLFVLLVVGALVVFGAARAAIEKQQGESNFLVSLVILTTVIGYTMMQRPMKTQQGDAALSKHQEMRGHIPAAQRADDLFLAVALSGADVLASTPYAPIYTASQEWKNSFNTG